MILAALTFVLGLTSCAALTYLVRKHALARQILDHPNERSSHRVATPRGGGLAIAIVTLSIVLIHTILGYVEIRLALAILCGGIAIAWIGWMDDISHARVPTRLAVQVLAASGAVVFLGGMPHMTFGTTTVSVGTTGGGVLAVLGIVWCTNLYNFMDGIDGIAASEAVVVAGTGAVLAILSGRVGLGLVLATLAGTSSGFLFWNWQPARIFMGDVGSGLIGFLLGTCAIAAQGGRPVPMTIWLVLLLVFLGDATITLGRRLRARESLHVAHRSHAYQRIVQAGWSHQRATLTVLLIDGILILLAVTMWRWPTLTPALVFVALLLVGSTYLLVERTQPMHFSGARDAR